MITRRHMLLSGACLSVASLANVLGWTEAFAQTASELDLRSLPISENNFFIVFSARTQSLLPEALTSQQFSLGGHAYVALGSEDPQKAMSYARTFGAHPVEDAMGKWSILIGPIPGAIREVLQKDISARLIIRVDEDDYADAIISRWARKGQYQLLWEDCTTMINEVARLIGLTVPDRGAASPSTWFPSGASAKLITGNPQSAFLNGTWDSGDPAKRFRLEIKGDSCKWTERSSAGKSLSVSVKVEKDGTSFRIAQPNDATTLAFAGARPSVASEIIARSPAPSFMTLDRSDGRTLNGRWCGLKWTLDDKNRLVDVVPPGTSATNFRFVQATA
ncbi:hypothetical protein HFO89_10890 [Rhizobium leguminosarum]|uniref:hypothetical protein n=1 Tax=Rhizobium leguminosarum TaxID=384 RepID=UPI001C972A74|nr:hypothetical protein [Rhizobium leguminosarum]MBY5456866.1 hypothetical protein [Rhizobium leguminosarum]